MVDLSAEGPVRDLRIMPNPLDFGDIYVGCEREQDVTIENVGTDAVNYKSERSRFFLYTQQSFGYG